MPETVHDGALSEDLRRYLGNQPIAARPDSPWYRVRVRAQALVVRRPGFALAAIVAIAAAISHFAVAPIVFATWSHANPWFERLALAAFPPAREQTLSTVRMILLTDDDNAEQLAAEHEIEGVSNTEVVSLRRLHGKLMQRLAAARPLVVAFDITFRSETEHDAAFAAGVRALQDAGIDAIVAVPDWKVDPQGAPAVSPALLDQVKWGTITAMLSPDGPWLVDLAVARPDRAHDAMLGLAARAFASARRPSAEVAASVHPNQGMLDLSYWRPNARNPSIRQWLEPSDQVAVSTVLTQPVDELLNGLHQGDLRAMMQITVPPDDVIDAATLTYSQALRADDTALAAAIRDRAVIVANARSGLDRHRTPDGRIVSGCICHALALDSMLRSAIMTRPRPAVSWTILIAGAAAGVLWGGVASRRTALRVAGYVGAAAILLALMLIWFGLSRMLVNPLMPLACVVLAGELWALVARVRSERSAAVGTASAVHLSSAPA